MMAWEHKERRFFDRVTIPSTANMFIEDDQGNRLGRVAMLGRGGFLLSTERRFPALEPLHMILVAEHDGVRRSLNVIQRYTSPSGEVGFEFHDLEPTAAVEIGVLLGKYFKKE